MNNDLISRSEVIEELQYLKLIGYDNSSFAKIENNAIQRCIEVVTDAPVVDIPNYGGQVVPDMLQGWRYEERPQGEWIELKNYPFPYVCNKCGYERTHKANFCENCGARMKGGAE